MLAHTAEEILLSDTHTTTKLQARRQPRHPSQERRFDMDLAERRERQRAEERHLHRTEMRKEFGGRGRTFDSLLGAVNCEGGGGKGRKLAKDFFGNDEV